MKKIINEAQKIDGHFHAFGMEHVPKNLFGFITRFIGKNDTRLKIASWLVSHLIPSKLDSLEKYARLLKYLALSTEDKIKIGLKRVDLLVVLTMDFTEAKAGKIEVSFEEQLDELIYLRDVKKYPILIYMHLDPKRKDFMDLVNRYAGFVDGWKLYPALTGYPTHDFIQWALIKYPKPVICHMNRTSPVFYQGNVKSMIDWKHWTSIKGSQKDMCQSFNHPYWLKVLAENNPHIPFDFSHIGGYKGHFVEQDRKYIIEILLTLPNAFGSGAYTFHDEEFADYCKRIIKYKYLDGTDDFMCEPFRLGGQGTENMKRFLTYIK